MNTKQNIILFLFGLLQICFFALIGKNFISCLNNKPFIHNIYVTSTNTVTHTVTQTMTQTVTQIQYVENMKQQKQNKKNNSIYLQIFFKKPQQHADLTNLYNEHILYIHNYTDGTQDCDDCFISNFKITDSDDYFKQHLTHFCSNCIWINDRNNKMIISNNKIMFYKIITAYRFNVINNKIKYESHNALEPIDTKQIIAIMDTNNYQHMLTKYNNHVPFILQIMFYADTEEELNNLIINMIMECSNMKLYYDGHYTYNDRMIVQCALDHLELGIEINELYISSYGTIQT